MLVRLVAGIAFHDSCPKVTRWIIAVDAAVVIAAVGSGLAVEGNDGIDARELLSTMRPQVLGVEVKDDVSICGAASRIASSTGTRCVPYHFEDCFSSISPE